MGNCCTKSQTDLIAPGYLVLPKLSYSFDGLEPVISCEILDIHYTKHHKKYIDEYNSWVPLLKEAMTNKDFRFIQKCIDKLKFNYGGHQAHSLYWGNLLPKIQGGGTLPNPDSKFSKDIFKNWNSYENFINEFNLVCGEIQGSGWCWLAISSETKELFICSTEQHDSVEASGSIPLLVIDVWEHAYYLQYKNAKADYFTRIWQVVNWEEVSKRYSEAFRI